MTQTVSQPVSKPTDPYVAQFERIENDLGSKSPSWLMGLRKTGIAYFAELGFPTIQHEEWRFTNVAPIAKLAPVFDLPPGTVTAREMAPFNFEGMKCTRLVFVNGRFSPELSFTSPELKGITAGSLAAALTADPDAIQRHLGRHVRCDENPFVALNTALFQDGALIEIPEGQVLQEPVYVLFIAAAPGGGANIHSRNLIVAGRNSQAAIIERYVSLEDTPYLTNAVTEMVLGDSAVLDHCKLQDESEAAFHIATVQAQLARQCNFTSHSISSGGRITRNNINLALNGEGVDCILNGLYLAHGDQVVDHHTVADHAKPHCQSHEFYHGILDGRSRGVFNGKIFVRKAAQKTDAKQTNRNLLLSDEAAIDTKPQLEIFADDVKCTHGATVGQLDEDAIFYLRSRGIGPDDARDMLVHAFASDVINRIKQEPVREQLELLLTHRLDRPHGKDA
jgi:Fe-S cluster assembly protein SufD